MLTEQQGCLFSPKRLDRRMRVFKTICLPSILNQTSKRFYWVLLIDQKLNDKYREQLEDLTKEHDFIRILEWKPETYKLSRIDWLADAGIDTNVNHMITTRLDDDDALHADFTKLIQEYYKQKGHKVNYLQFITFPTGLIWMAKRGMNPFKMPFIALGMTLNVNVKNVPVNVYGFNHAHLKNSYKLRLKNPPYIYKWLSSKLKRTITYRNFQLKNAMLSIQTKIPMYIYSIHGENDSAAKYYAHLFRNGGMYPQQTVRQMIKQFGLNWSTLQKL